MSYLVVLLAVLTRFIPHMPNFSPVFGALLFGGAHLKCRDAVWYPLVLLAASNVVLTLLVYHMRMGWSQGITWMGFTVVTLIGYWLRERQTVARIGFASLAGPTAFFLISNFGVWIGGYGARMYPASLDGLAACYLAAVPFYGNSLLATVAYTALLFGAYEILQKEAHWDRRHSPRKLKPSRRSSILGNFSRTPWRVQPRAAYCYRAAWIQVFSRRSLRSRGGNCEL